MRARPATFYQTFVRESRCFDGDILSPRRRVFDAAVAGNMRGDHYYLVARLGQENCRRQARDAGPIACQ